MCRLGELRWWLLVLVSSAQILLWFDYCFFSSLGATISRKALLYQIKLYESRARPALVEMR